MRKASGSFEIEMTRQPPHDTAEGATLSRATGVKHWKGDLEGTSTLEMLSAVSEVKGSAGYVAIERVSGSLEGRPGSFVLQHTGTMNRGASALTVSVVPDSGTGALKGLTGQMTIDVVDGWHLYAFDYSLDRDSRPGRGRGELVMVAVACGHFFRMRALVRAVLAGMLLNSLVISGCEVPDGMPKGSAGSGAGGRAGSGTGPGGNAGGAGGIRRVGDRRVRRVDRRVRAPALAARPPRAGPAG